MNISSKELKKMARNQLSGKYGTFIGTNVLYILITLVASNLMDLSHRGLLSVDLYSLTDPLGTEYRSVKDRP